MTCNSHCTLAGLICLTAAAASPCAAQEYPTKPIRYIVPFGAALGQGIFESIGPRRNRWRQVPGEYGTV